MRIRLLKKWRAYPIGTIMNVVRQRSLKLINDKEAEEYNGPYPPTEKMKTEFFKPKE